MGKEHFSLVVNQFARAFGKKTNLSRERSKQSTTREGGRTMVFMGKGPINSQTVVSIRANGATTKKVGGDCFFTAMEILTKAIFLTASNTAKGPTNTQQGICTKGSINSTSSTATGECYSLTAMSMSVSGREMKSVEKGGILSTRKILSMGSTNKESSFLFSRLRKKLSNLKWESRG
jgi:hypothetical protein